MMRIWSTYRSDFASTLRLAWPIMLGQLGQVSVNIIDNLMVGSLGPNALASVSLGMSIFVVFLVVGVGISMGLQPLVAEADGRGEEQEISFVFKHSLIINIAFALICVAVLESIVPLFSYLGQDPVVLEGAIPYLRICTWSIVPMMVFQAFRGLSEGLSITAAPMWAILAGNLVNVLCNYAFIFGHWGAPEMGVSGAAVGTLIGRVAMVIVVLLLLRFRPLRPGVSPWARIMAMDPLRYSHSLFRKVLRLGVPTSLQMLFEVGAFAAAAIMMGAIGAIEQAAHQITINAVSATFMVCVGISVAATVRVGNALGRGNREAMRKSGISALILATVFMSMTAVLLGAFRWSIPSLYIDDLAVIEIASILFLVAAVFKISDGIQVTAIGALRGMQDIWWPTFITFFAYICIGLPFSWFSAFTWDMGPLGIWLGLLIGLSLSAWLNARRFLKLSV